MYIQNDIVVSVEIQTYFTSNIPTFWIIKYNFNIANYDFFFTIYNKKQHVYTCFVLW